MKLRKLFLYVANIVLFFAVAAEAQETLAQSVVRHRDFFVQLNGYSDCLLIDVEVIDRKSIGIILLSPEGFEQHFVFDATSMIPIYANARILSKNERDFLFDTSIKMSEVKRLAIAAKTRAAELRRGWTLHEGKPGNIIPDNLSVKETEPNPVTVTIKVESIRDNHKNRDHISNISKEIENDVAAISTKEILERFRAEVSKFSTSESVA
jgi:hypothetical protein